ncbi:tyrosine-type recombinase/integrase [Rhodoligotrophos defluvii]|uniref:tyrosine-type recombinase/integrase n=1 Tax=Rhodoligotrophos defluvii TaxID=2561934 RepID=UPI0010C98B33|nr:site-specific integrase [Rhodoligotrophos defluvii]
MPKERITNDTLKRLKPPATGNIIVWDTEVRGFGARITAAGAIAFIVNYTIHGRERRYTFGHYPHLPAAEARKNAAALRQKVLLGADPMQDREGQRSAPTVDDLCDQYIKKHAKPRKRPSSLMNDQSMISRIIKPKLGNRKVAEISHDDIDELHRSLKTTPYAANRVLSLLSKMFNLASEKWKWRSDNPCRGVERYPEDRRQRYLKPDELQRLMTAMTRHRNQQSANAVRLLLLTGARRSEVLNATWSQFDLQTGIWTKPSSHTKAKREHRVPLSGLALELLKEMKAKADAEAREAARNGRIEAPTFLFPSSSREGAQGHLKKFWRSVCKAAGLGQWVEKRTREGRAVLNKRGEPVTEWRPDVRIHDLRHSFASLLASSGASLLLIGELLGHTQAQTTKRYSHLFDDPMREAANRVGQLVSGASGAVR